MFQLLLTSCACRMNIEQHYVDNVVKIIQLPFPQQEDYVLVQHDNTFPYDAHANYMICKMLDNFSSRYNYRLVSY